MTNFSKEPYKIHEVTGRYFDRRYWRVKVNDHPHVQEYPKRSKYIYEQRFEMEKKLGRYLKPKEVVIFKDADVGNVSHENLILTDTRGQNRIIDRVGLFVDRGGDTAVFGTSGPRVKKKVKARDIDIVLVLMRRLDKYFEGDWRALMPSDNYKTHKAIKRIIVALGKVVENRRS